ncbi:Flp pilus assembly protein CpaB [Marininema mesophilum]|uniref:Flp pilus assembly protein CpaB n=1 Tax=Marininema mesophilum TaxID=1048340 RepID=A0A1H2X4G7_9BACL|nr:SAF domain-containing protein [Marininema mesophilum]SDW87636.1 Flp pilus assembly protein CpaB [Marininema mesophilum]
MQDAKRRAIIFAVLSVLLAGVAAYMFLEESNALRAGLGEERMVLVAKRDISSREPLRRTDFDLKSIPVRYYKPNQVGDLKLLDGKVSVVAIAKGDELTSNVLRPATQLEDPAKRLVGLRTSERVLFDDMFQSQDRVDILVSYERENGKGYTKFLLSDKLVFSVAKGNKAIGVELSLDESKRLVEAENFAHSIRVLKAPQKQDQPGEGTKQQPGTGTGKGQQKPNPRSGQQGSNTKQQPAQSNN